MSHPLVSISSNIDQVFSYDETLGYKGKDSRDKNTKLTTTTTTLRSPSLHSYFPRTTTHQLKEQSRRFIVYLEPSSISPLVQSINKFYRLSRVKFGPNEAHLYHPHCSMTGFLSLSPHQISNVLSTITRCLTSWCPPYDQFPTPSLSSIHSDSSRVVLKLAVPPFYHALVANLVEAVHPLATLRPKPLNHISLAYLNKHVPTATRFQPDQITALADLARTTLDLNSPVAWDIVVYEQSYCSTDLYHPHQFRELFRRPVARP